MEQIFFCLLGRISDFGNKDFGNQIYVFNFLPIDSFHFGPSVSLELLEF